MLYVYAYTSVWALSIQLGITLVFGATGKGAQYPSARPLGAWTLRALGFEGVSTRRPRETGCSATVELGLGDIYVYVCMYIYIYILYMYTYLLWFVGPNSKATLSPDPLAPGEVFEKCV